MGRLDYIFGQFRDTARCRDAQHGGRVCCAFRTIACYTCIQWSTFAIVQNASKFITSSFSYSEDKLARLSLIGADF